MNYLIRFIAPLAIFGLLSVNAIADENASGGVIINSETVVLGGPFDHGGALGSADNSLTTATFVGGFNATNVRFTGTFVEVLLPTFGSEADIQITSPAIPPSPAGTPFVWQNPSPTVGPFDFDSSQDLTGAGFGGPGGTVDPNGTWDIEFFDTFDDGPGADAQSTNLSITFEEVSPITDSNGVFSLGSLAGGGTATSAGEFALGGLFDTYDITLTQDGFLTLTTDENLAGGFNGFNADTEIGIFDSAGVLIDNDDDGGNGLFSGLFDLELAAGDYQIVVGTFNTLFADGPTITPGGGTGDYFLSAAFTAVPEPSSFTVLMLGLCGFGLARRRKS